MSQKSNTKIRQSNQDYEIKAYPNTYKLSGTNQKLDLKQNNSPKYSFGKSIRDEQRKRYFSKQMAKTYNFGKQTTMLHLNAPKDQFNYTRSPSWKINTKSKRTTQPHYQYYQYENDSINIQKSDAIRRPKSAQIRFGTQQRFKNEVCKTPGPQYYPQIQTKVKQPQYSIGMRRAVKGHDPLKPLQSSNKNIGPGVYHPEKSPLTAKHIYSPKWTIPRSPKLQKVKSNTLNQTYQITSSLGAQKLSNKSSQPKITINKTNRSSKALILSAHMQYRHMKVIIPHPNFS